MPAMHDNTTATREGERLSRRGFLLAVLLACALALLLRAAFQPADPPSHATVGITWHDEGVWAHNARNKALFGAWTTDGWNPMYVSPVFTGLEWLAFKAFGVGLSQARLPSILLSTLSILGLALGVRAVGTRLAGAAAAWLAATSYVYVMYGRVALLEATMVGLLVASWCCYALSRRRPALGILAGILAVAAFFAKASAVFFLVALGVDGCWAIASALRRRRGTGQGIAAARLDPEARSAAFTLAAMAAATVLALVVFVVPNWTEYLFYNVRLYGSRRSAAGIGVILDRASWLPIIHDFFTRMMVLTWVSLAGVVAAAFDWPRRAAGERVLWLWLILGAAELILQDTGNERRFVFLIPAMAAIGALVIARDFRLLPGTLVTPGVRRAWMAMPLVAYALYVAWGTVARLPFLYETRPGVRLAAALAIISTAGIGLGWGRGVGRFLTRPWGPGGAVLLLALMVAGDLAQFAQWAATRSYKNVEASRALRDKLPWGTPVLGKLANGLSLENGIRPLYIGQGFGNYANAAMRARVPYVLTYTIPRLGYEGPAILEVLDQSPGWRVAWTFPVSETSSGRDKAALIVKSVAEEAR
jgi:4-amino-4-deoxy-L-arabinose transferase-like glycosyltransferase